jgi:hypothetical protein
MKKSTFIDYAVIMAVLSHKKKRNSEGTNQQKPTVLEPVRTVPELSEEEEPVIMALYSRELVA